MHVTGDRTGRARAVHDRLRRRGRGRPRLGHRARRRAGRLPARPADGGTAAAQRWRSNGCAFADSPLPHADTAHGERVAAADPDGPSTEELIAGVERGIYIVGDRSWSIDMQRYNFQFTGQRFYRIENGRLVGQLRDVGLSGDDDRLLGVDGGASAARRPSCWAAPSTAARANQARSRRSRTAAPAPCSGRSTCSTPGTRAADEKSAGEPATGLGGASAGRVGRRRLRGHRGRAHRGQPAVGGQHA